MSSKTEDIQNLVDSYNTISSAFLKFSNTLKTIRGSNTLTEESRNLLHQHHQELKNAVSSFAIPGIRQTRKLAISGEISLDELRESIDTSRTTKVPDVLNLQSADDIFVKLKLLYSWEQDANRTNIRVAFHQGFYISELLAAGDNTINSIQKSTEIPEFNIRKNLKLYKELGIYRTLLCSTLRVSRLQRNIAAIRKLLSTLSEEEKKWWKYPSTELTGDPSCFVKCYLEYFEGKQLPTDIFYKLDLIDNQFDHPTARKVIDKLCVRVMICKDQHDCNEKLRQLTEEKYLLGFMKKQDEVGHFTTLTRNQIGSYDVDEITEEAFKLPTPWVETIIYKFK